MICPVCGSELREDAKFCNVCGFEIGIEDQINIREIRQKITKFRLPNFVGEIAPYVENRLSNPLGSTGSSAPVQLIQFANSPVMKMNWII